MNWKLKLSRRPTHFWVASVIYCTFPWGCRCGCWVHWVLVVGRIQLLSSPLWGWFFGWFVSWFVVRFVSVGNTTNFTDINIHNCGVFQRLLSHFASNLQLNVLLPLCSFPTSYPVRKKWCPCRIHFVYATNWTRSFWPIDVSYILTDQSTILAPPTIARRWPCWWQRWWQSGRGQQ